MGNVMGIQISCDAIVSSCLNCTLKNAAYVSQLEDNLGALQTQLLKLIEAKNDVMMRVVNAEQQQMTRLNQVQGWLLRVEAVETSVRELTRDSTPEIERLCLGGYCSKNYRSSYKFGKQVAKTLQLVATLMGEGAFEVVAEKIPEPAVDERPCEPTIVGLDSTFDEVWRCLEEEEEVGIIGLYGMGGVGKTTLLTKINNKFLDTPNNFDIVIWVVVSKNMQLDRIQEKIGERIGLPAKSMKKSLEEKAAAIFKILSKKKFVLLLDDIWERIDLGKVGVPFPSLNNASKVIFTTRLRDVCGLMEAHRKFKVECLGDKEAWQLFLDKVGEETLNSHPDIPKLANTVAKECGGLPLALISIGRTMGCKKTPEEWRYAIEMLKRSASEFPGMGKEVYPLLKFSYDCLPSDIVRSCLLYCSLFPEDFSIRKSQLIDSWIGEGFLNDYEGIGAGNQGYYFIGVLLHACLLEEMGSEHVKMHDVIRDMCLWIACEVEKGKENYLVHAGARLTEAPEIRKWEGVRRVSLMKNKIENLSEIPKCPDLLTLFLQNNDLKMITSDFFQSMHSLRVLNLSYNGFLTKLPSGISKLVSLQCLDLSWTNIQVLDTGLKSLVNLRCLNLEHARVLHTIPRQLISSLTKLQVLKMFGCGEYTSDQAGEDSVLSGVGELLVEELLGLKHLIVLTTTLQSSHALQRFIKSHKFKSCTQSLNLRCFDSKSFDLLCLSDLKHLSALNIVSFKLLEQLKIGSSGEVQIAQQHHCFHSLRTVRIFSCCKLRDLTWLVFAPNLELLNIKDCSDMEEIVNAGKLGEGSEMMANPGLFTRLRLLCLKNLPNLKSVYWKALPFPHLNAIEVVKCPELQKFPLDFNHARLHKIRVFGQEDWWKELQWEDPAAQDAFHPSFRSADFVTRRY